MKLVIAIIVLAAIVLPLLPDGTGDVVGRIRIPALDIIAWVTMDDDTVFDCPVLWGGGVVYTDADLSAVCLDDIMHLYTFDGSHHVMECVGIMPCIRWDRWLIGWRGVIRANGDVLVVSGGKVYRWIRL